MIPPHLSQVDDGSQSSDLLLSGENRRVKWIRDVVILAGTLCGSIVLALPVKLMRNGWDDLGWWLVTVSAPFLAIGCLEVLRRLGKLVDFLRDRTFAAMTSRAFLIGIPNVVVSVLGAVWPAQYFAGVQWGMFVGLLTPARYGTLDYPQVPNRSYWLLWGTLGGCALGLAVALSKGRSAPAIAEGAVTTILYGGGLWIGLLIGNQLKAWIAAMTPVFVLVRRMGKVLTAFGVGYGCIVVFFATCFAAVFRLEGPDSFTGIAPGKDLSTFVYYSLVTATTVGYGDIVPHSALARTLMAVETVLTQAWTLVVFAAVALQFSKLDAQAALPSEPDEVAARRIDASNVEKRSM